MKEARGLGVRTANPFSPQWPLSCWCDTTLPWALTARAPDINICHYSNNYFSILCTLAGAQGLSRLRFSVLAAVYSTHAKLDPVPSSESSKSNINCEVKSQTPATWRAGVCQHRSQNCPGLQLGQEHATASSAPGELSSAIESPYLESCL